MKKIGRFAFQLLFLAVLAIAVFLVFHAPVNQTKPAANPRGGKSAAGGPPPNILAASASLADVPVYITAVGTVTALNTVAVRAQVDGKLLSVDLKEGQDVKKGDVLATIDPATFQAAYDQAAAKRAQDAATYANAQKDLVRYTKLAAESAGTKQQADTQSALVSQLAAQIKSDDAAIESAKATLSYTKIVAPISGRLGLLNTTVGNQIHASDTTPLVTITQIKPIAVVFNAPQQQLANIMAAVKRGDAKVEVSLSESGESVDIGNLAVIDNQIDPTTGTIKLKAEFPNANLSLWPGAFVNVRLLVKTLLQVIQLPDSVLQHGPTGTFVYVLNDSVVKIRPVKVAYETETNVVLSEGVKPGEMVVTSGFAQLSDGTKVKLSQPESSAKKPPA